MFRLFLDSVPLHPSLLPVEPIRFHSYIQDNPWENLADLIISEFEVSGWVNSSSSGDMEILGTGIQTNFNELEILHYYNGTYTNSNMRFKADDGWNLKEFVVESGTNSFGIILSKQSNIGNYTLIKEPLYRETTWHITGSPLASSVFEGSTGVWEYGYLTQTDYVRVAGRNYDPIYNFIDQNSRINQTIHSRQYHPDYGFLETTMTFEIINSGQYIGIVETGIESTGIIYHTGLYEDLWSEGPYDIVDWTGALTKESTTLRIYTDTGFDSWATWRAGPFEMSGWNSLEIEWAGAYTGAADLDTVGFLGIDPASGTGYLDYEEYLTRGSLPFGLIDNLNISSASGQYYIYIGLRTTGKSASVTLDTSRVELLQ